MDITGYIERFNGKFRREYLKADPYASLARVAGAIAVLQQDYDEIRPLGRCRGIAPAKFAALRRSRGADTALPKADKFPQHCGRTLCRATARANVGNSQAGCY